MTEARSAKGEPWSPEEAEQLRLLRLQAGLDPVQLGRQHALSVQQIEQLETGGDSCFYSPGIKAAAGRRLLHKLNAI